jgi:hypothetical protein
VLKVGARLFRMTGRPQPHLQLSKMIVFSIKRDIWKEEEGALLVALFVNVLLTHSVPNCIIICVYFPCATNLSSYSDSVC